MIIKKIKLENIRSYVDQELEFPEGSTLLAGDIGSGKSSVLLAIDFALFGLRKGNLSGASLLRNGSNNGSVEMHFNLNDKNIIIQRNLKRANDSVVQDSGYIIVDGERRDASPIELKQDILGLLNYPKELLTKSKSLIYRYTVYTPQEEMKYILLGEKDIRLDTLRKVFDIDKYKRINENCKIFINNLKQKRKEYEGKIYDLDYKNKDLKNKINEINYANELLKELIPKITAINHDVDKKRSEIKLLEEENKKLDEFKKDLGLNELRSNNLIEKREYNSREIESLISNINKLDEEIKNIKLEGFNYNQEIELTRNSLEKNEIELNKINSLINEFEFKKNHSIDIKNKLIDIDLCPLCLQKVSHEHKSSINNDEDKKISDYDKELLMNKDKKNILQNTIKEIKNKLEKLRQENSKLELYKLKKENLNEKNNKKNIILREQEKISSEIILYDDRIKLIREKIMEFKEINFDDLKKELELLLTKEKNLEIERAKYISKIQELNKIINDLEIEIQSKLLIKNKINYLNDINFWLENYFINVVNLIEKQIMLNVYNDFNSLFQKWFNMLMEIENFNVKLDEEFTPLIQQNGYDINYEYLSGGEKTAIALSYRLALNQVINNLLTTIKTKDLLILDEPTDGFSDEQLDRVRNVLNELNIKQLIIVSHEQKIESFVDNIIRLNKEQHISKIL